MARESFMMFVSCVFHDFLIPGDKDWSNKDWSNKIWSNKNVMGKFDMSIEWLILSMVFPLYDSVLILDERS